MDCSNAIYMFDLKIRKMRKGLLYFVGIVFFVFKFHIKATGKSLFLDYSQIENNYDSNINKLGDSLVLADKFPELIQLFESKLNNDSLHTKVLPYLVCAYYYNGDTTKSMNLLMNEIKGLSYKEIIHKFLISYNLGFIKLFESENIRNKVINLVISKYKNVEHITNPIEGETIIRFFIQDQMSRKVKYIYVTKEKYFVKQFDLRRAKEISIQNGKILAFYKKSNKIFNKEEVGDEVSTYQPIILCHYSDVEIRYSFFVPFLKEQIVKNRWSKRSLANFILRTEFSTNPDFKNNLEKRENEIIKELGLTNDYSYNPF